MIFRYQHEKEEIEHDISNAIDKIERWKAHILRAVHQDEAKDDTLNNMTPEQALIIMDWALLACHSRDNKTEGRVWGIFYRHILHLIMGISKTLHDGLSVSVCTTPLSQIMHKSFFDNMELDLYET